MLYWAGGASWWQTVLEVHWRHIQKPAWWTEGEKASIGLSTSKYGKQYSIVLWVVSWRCTTRCFLSLTILSSNTPLGHTSTLFMAKLLLAFASWQASKGKSFPASNTNQQTGHQIAEGVRCYKRTSDSHCETLSDILNGLKKRKCIAPLVFPILFLLFPLHSLT